MRLWFGSDDKMNIVVREQGVQTSGSTYFIVKILFCYVDKSTMKCMKNLNNSGNDIIVNNHVPLAIY